MLLNAHCRHYLLKHGGKATVGDWAERKFYMKVVTLHHENLMNRNNFRLIITGIFSWLAPHCMSNGDALL